MHVKKSQISPPAEPNSVERVSAATYREHAAEISILMGNFFLRYLGHIYREFKGDFAAVIVLGEIGHHNFNHCYSGQGAGFRIIREKVKDPARWERLHSCNAFSLSAATGIPRETVRRKITELVSRGWLRRTAKGEVFLTKAVPKHFYSEFDLRVLRELLEVAQQLQNLLGGSTTKPRQLPDVPARSSKKEPTAASR